MRISEQARAFYYVPLAREPYKTAFSMAGKRLNTAWVFPTVCAGRPWFMGWFPADRQARQSVGPLRQKRDETGSKCLWQPPPRCEGHKGFAGCIPGTDDACKPLFFEIILQHIPGKFVGKLKPLNHSLLFQFRQIALPG